MNKLNTFYKKIITSLGLHVDDDGYVYVGEGRNKQLMNIKGKMLALPTKANIDSMLVLNDKGVAEVVKELYNPLRESAIKSQNESLTITKDFIEIKLGFTFYAIGELLLQIIRASNLQKNAGPDILTFLNKVGNVKTKAIKELVDDASIDKWAKLYQKYSNNNTYLTIYVTKNSKTHDGTKYNRVAALDSKLYGDLLEVNEDKTLEGEKLRTKDIAIYKAIFELLLEGIESNDNTIKIGSNDVECPGFVALMTLYVTLANRLNNINNQVKFINSDQSIKLEIPLEDITIEQLNNLAEFKSELEMIPNNMVHVNKQQQPQQVVQQPSVPVHKVEAPVINSTHQQYTQQHSVPTISKAEPVQQVQQQVVHNPVPYNQTLTQAQSASGSVTDKLKAKLANDPSNMNMITLINTARQNAIQQQQAMLPVQNINPMVQQLQQQPQQMVYVNGIPTVSPLGVLQQVNMAPVGVMPNQVLQQVPVQGINLAGNPYQNVMPTTNMYNNVLVPRIG